MVEATSLLIGSNTRTVLLWQRWRFVSGWFELTKFDGDLFQKLFSPLEVLQAEEDGGSDHTDVDGKVEAIGKRIKLRPDGHAGRDSG